MRDLTVLFLLLMMLTTSTGWASGKNPQEPTPPPTRPGVREKANQALDTVEHDVKAVAREVKNEVNKVLQSIDDSIHKTSK